MSDWRIEPGDVLERLREMPAESVHCVVTSPPYFGLRDYGIPGQMGLEATPEAFIARMVEVFREIRRVLRSDGTCWVNMGDSYASSWACNRRSIIGNGSAKLSERADRRSGSLKEKDLMMMPARLALALQADDWWLRSEITWCKRAPMPESVTDRPTSATEKIYLLTKAAKYFYDADAVREPHTAEDRRGAQRVTYDIKAAGQSHAPSMNAGYLGQYEGGRNLWNYWLLSPEPYAAAHFATFPTEIPRRAILAGTSERGACAECGAPWRRVVSREYYGAVGTDHIENGKGTGWKRASHTGQGDNAHWKPPQHVGWQPTCRHTDAPTVPCTVLDPFSGAGTTVMVALRLGRRGVGIELNPEYVAMSRERIIGDAPMFNTPLEQSA